MQAQDALTISLLKLWSWLEANIKRVVIATGILAAVIFVFSFFSYQRQQKEITAGQALTTLVVSVTESTNRSQIADDYFKLASEYPGTEAGKRAALQGAAALFTSGKYAEAQTQFQKYLDAHPDDLLAAQAALGVASSLEAQGDSAAASSAYQKVITQFPDSPAAVSAKLSAGRVYESQGKWNDARNLYADIVRSNPNSPLASEANQRLMELSTVLSTNAVPFTTASPVKP